VGEVARGTDLEVDQEGCFGREQPRLLPRDGEGYIAMGDALDMRKWKGLEGGVECTLRDGHVSVAPYPR
jgi:hypothetical protein